MSNRLMEMKVLRINDTWQIVCIASEGISNLGAQM
mgnify:CR=1 FL=1